MPWRVSDWTNRIRYVKKHFPLTSNSHLHAKPICEGKNIGKNKFALLFSQPAFLCIYWVMYSHAPCSIDLVETAIFDPGVTVSSPVVSVSFAVGVKGVEIAVALSVAFDVTVFSFGGFVLTENDGEECDVEDNVAAITVDDVVIVVTEDVTSLGVVIDDVGTTGVDDVGIDVDGDVAVFLTRAVDDAGVVVVDGLDDEVARVSTGAVEDTITIDETGEAEGEGVTSMSPGFGQ